MRIVSVVGARPQFVKLAAICKAVDRRSSNEGWVHRIIHTGQHYDAELSSVFFEELAIPRPDDDLEVGSGSHGALTTHAPDRLLDTRDGTGLPGATPERVGPGQVVSVDLTGKVPEGTRAVVVNLTGTGPNLATHLTAFPAGGEPPLASNLNLGPGQTAANLAMVPLGDDNKIAIRNNVGAVDVVVDLFGYL